MNLPNKLTTLRIIMIPFFILFMSVTIFAGNTDRYIALGIFCIASFTDFLDGYIARKNNLVTNFGKFMDPLADKLLVVSAMICLMDIGRFPAVVLQIIIAREFIISGFRLVASDNGVVIAAGMMGKLKTVCTMLTIIVLLMELSFSYMEMIEQVLIYLTLGLTVLSLIEYIYKNKAVILDGNI